MTPDDILAPRRQFCGVNFIWRRAGAVIFCLAVAWLTAAVAAGTALSGLNGGAFVVPAWLLLLAGFVGACGGYWLRGFIDDWGW